ncbi:MAG TPA: DUF1552 domain-containing protein [Polyangiales bacterium]
MNRRRFLRGLGGVVVGLPMLESLWPRSVGHAQAVAPRRLITFFQCNGANMDLIWPKGGYGALTAAHFSSERSLSPLANYRDKLLIPRNLHMSPKGFGQDPNTNGCDHQKGTAQKLTAAPLNSSGFATGVSIDQFVAKQVNAGGKAAMTLGVHYVGSGPTGSISYSASGRPVTSESNPRLAFQDLMGITATQPVQRDLLGERRKSVLDLVHADFDALKVKQLSKSDQVKLEQHFSTIRDLEKAVMPGAMMPTSGCTPLDAARANEIKAADQGVQITSDAQFKRVGRMQMDMIALALACDQNRVATLQWGSGAGGPIFSWDGMSHQYNHHKLSHGNTKDDDSGSAVAGYEGMIAAIDRWFAGEFVYLLDKLNAYTEGSGKTLLDNSCVLWINELSDGKGHDFRDLPVIMAGSCGGAFKQGQFINMSRHADAREVNFPDLDAPHNKLLTTIANAMGAKGADGGRVTHFGDTRYGAAGDYSQLLV